jgi:type II secretory pathway pseudopilin PulG
MHAMAGRIRNSRRFCGRSRDAGFTYIGLLAFIVIMGISLAATGVVFFQESRREKEKQLLFAGGQIRDAISEYYRRSPGSGRFPQTLEDLLLDQRQPTVQRYLRRVYVDPMTGHPDWELVRGPDGGIRGVHSKSTAKPLKISGFPKDFEDFADRKSYAEWEFTSTELYFEEASPGIPPPAGAPAR